MNSKLLQKNKFYRVETERIIFINDINSDYVSYDDYYERSKNCFYYHKTKMKNKKIFDIMFQWFKELTETEELLYIYENNKKSHL